MTGQRTGQWSLVAPLLTLTTLVVMIVGIDGPVRAAVVCTFVTVAPGLAIFRRLALPLEPALCVSVVVPTSWSIGAGVALVQLYAEVWSIELAVGTLGLFVIALSLPDMLPSRAFMRRKRQRMTTDGVDAP